AEEFHGEGRAGPRDGDRERLGPGRGQPHAAAGQQLGGGGCEARLLTLRDDPAPVVDQHPAPVSGGPPGLYDDLRERHAPERLDRMNVDRVQTRVPHGAILPYGGGRLPGQRLSIRGTAGRCTDPGTEPGRGAEPPPGASPRSPRRRAAPDAAAAAGGRGEI